MATDSAILERRATEPRRASDTPKIHSPAESFADFLIRRDRENPFVVQASGIESPGLTSCLAVGDLVASLVESGADLAN